MPTNFKSILRTLLYGKSHGKDKQMPSPDQCGLENTQVFFIRTKAGDIPCWYTPAKNGMPTILLFQGRKRTLGGDSINCRFKFFTDKGYGFACINPRNYGNGIQGDPLGMVDDDKAFMDFIIGQLQISPNQIYCMGHSLGTGRAAMMARAYNCAGLVLQSPYKYLLDINKLIKPFASLLKSPHNCLEPLALYHKPTFIFTGNSDAVIPVEHSTKLARIATLFGAPVQLVIYRGRGHLDIPKDVAFEEVHQFIQNPPKENVLQVSTHKKYEIKNLPRYSTIFDRTMNAQTRVNNNFEKPPPQIKLAR